MGEALANSQFAQILKTIWNTVKTITSGIVNSFSSISEAIISSLGEANFSGIIDLLNGVAYANGGQLKKVANNTFIITPYNVDVTGDLIDELENTGVFF